MADVITLDTILFNNLKHHLEYIKSFIREAIFHKRTQLLGEQLLSIGKSQMDVYAGELSVSDISFQIVNQLKELNITTKQLYKDFILQVDSDYKKISLSDDSIWVLRLGNQAEQYVHIHPARYAPHTFRAKAGVLKTAIAVRIWMQIYEEKDMNLVLMNRVRKEVLGASPVKSLAAMEGFAEIYQLLLQPGVINQI